MPTKRKLDDITAELPSREALDARIQLLFHLLFLHGSSYLVGSISIAHTRFSLCLLAKISSNLLASQPMNTLSGNKCYGPQRGAGAAAI
jgi:hypothetical protein